MKPKSFCAIFNPTLNLLAGMFFGLASSPAAPSMSVDSAVGGPGTTVMVAVHYTTDTNAATLGFDLLYDPTYLASGTPDGGDALSNHLVASAEPHPGVRRVIIFSASNTRITNGQLVSVPFTIRTNALDRNEPITFSNVVVANLLADAVPTLTTNGILAVATLPRFISISPSGGGAMHLELAAPPGQRFLIQSSRSVAQPIWTPLCTNVGTSDVLTFDDVGAAGLSSGFYRALVVP